MKQNTKTLGSKVVLAALGSVSIMLAGCQSLPWKKAEPSASANDTIGPVGGGQQQLVKIDAPFNADYDQLEQGNIYQRPSVPDQQSIIIEEPLISDVQIPGIEPLNIPSIQVKDDDLAYIVQRGDTLWGISQQFKVSLNKILSANGLSKTSVISIGQTLQIPGVAESETFQPTITLDLATDDVFINSSSYTVKRGDNLTKIAYLYGTSVRNLKSANGLITDRLLVGQSLNVPSGGPVRDAYKPAATTNTSAPAPTSGDGYHTVRSGEYPGSIARMYGLKASELMRLNNISDPSKLQVGTRLVVSRGASLPASVGNHAVAAPSASVLPAPASNGFDSIGPLPAPVSTPGTVEIPLQDIEEELIVPIEDAK